MRDFYRNVVTSLVFAAGTAVIAQPTYRIIDLTEVASGLGVIQAQADAINNAGEVIGYEAIEFPNERPLLWRADLTVVELSRLVGDTSARPHDITEDGLILGVSDEIEVRTVGHQLRIFQDMKAVTWTNEVVSRVDSLVTGGETTELRIARGMNASGTMIGYGFLPGGITPSTDSRGWTLKSGIVGDLGALQWPHAINSAGDIVGSTFGSQKKAYVYRGGMLTNLHDLAAIGGVFSQAYDINDSGTIVGEAQFHISKPEEAAIWIGNEVHRLVPDLARPQGVATAINNQGQIVGYYSDLDILNEGWHGFVWRDGERQHLLDLIDPALGWTELLAFDINDNGLIVGGGRRNGQTGRAFVMIPQLGCYADCEQSTGAGVLDIFDFLCFQDLFVKGNSYACDCDTSTGKGVCDVFDFLCFQDAFVAGCP